MDITAGYAIRSLGLLARRSARPSRLLGRSLLVAALVLVAVGWRSGTSEGAGAGVLAAGAHALHSAATEPQATVVDPAGLYHPVTPCRVLDTRSTGGAFANGQVRSYDVAGPVMTPKGTPGPDRCGIPEWAVAVAGTLTAVGSTGSGFVRAWPVGTSEPTATVLNYAKGASTGTGVTLTLAAVKGLSLTLKNYAGPTHLVLDVTGYYAEQLHVTVKGTGEWSGSRHVRGITTGTPEEGVFGVMFDRSLSECAAVATTKPTYGGASTYTWGNEVVVSTWLGTPQTHTRYALEFTLVVTC